MISDEDIDFDADLREENDVGNLDDVDENWFFKNKYIRYFKFYI